MIMLNLPLGAGLGIKIYVAIGIDGNRKEYIMKVTEVYINRKDLSEYPLHESCGAGYEKLINFAAEQIKYAIENYNTAISEINPEENLPDINDYIIDEENGLSFEDETSFTLTINDEPKIPFVDYFLYDGKIIFAELLPIGSLIKIKDIINKNKIITKNSYNNMALLHTFCSDQKLKFNNDYTFKINIPDEKEFNIEFESQFNPFYSNIKTIRKDMGDLIKGVKDKQIAQLIYGNSKDVYFTMKNADALDDLTDIEKNMYPQKITRYRTDIDLCWLLYYAVSGMYGSISKQIGTIEIEDNVKLPYIETMLKRFQEDLKELEDEMNDGTGTVLAFTKGGDTSYPVSNRGVF